jgi:hypothetical protein
MVLCAPDAGQQKAESIMHAFATQRDESWFKAENLLA